MSVRGQLPQLIAAGPRCPQFFSPYGQSKFADDIDAVQAVDLTFDALISEVDVSKMRVFLSDVMFDQKTDGKGKRIPIPFGKGDFTVFRKIMSTEDMVQEFAPALRTSSQFEAFRIALQMLGDLTVDEQRPKPHGHAGVSAARRASRA